MILTGSSSDEELHRSETLSNPYLGIARYWHPSATICIHGEGRELSGPLQSTARRRAIMTFFAHAAGCRTLVRLLCKLGSRFQDSRAVACRCRYRPVLPRERKTAPGSNFRTLHGSPIGRSMVPTAIAGPWETHRDLMADS